MGKSITEDVQYRWRSIEGRAHRRLRGWSVRRRWIVLVAVPLLLCCCGSVVGLPLWWAIRETLAAGRGEASPAAAVVVYVGKLGYGDDAPLALFDDDTQDTLVKQWAELRAAMAATRGGGPDRLDLVDLAEPPITDGRATVHATVSATWWGAGGTAGTSLQSPAKPWAVDVVDDDGWRVVRVSTPPWCGPDGYVAWCPGDPEPTPAPTSPSPSPADPLAEMLPCGPKDPFRDMPGRLISCPPS
jgi:hypothetical protein